MDEEIVFTTQTVGGIIQKKYTYIEHSLFINKDVYLGAIVKWGDDNRH